MEYLFAKSARKHKIGRAHALFVIAKNAPVEFAALAGKSSRLYWIGQDSRGVELEIIGLQLESQILIIHVMPRNFRRIKRRRSNEKG